MSLDFNTRNHGLVAHVTANPAVFLNSLEAKKHGRDAHATFFQPIALAAAHAGHFTFTHGSTWAVAFPTPSACSISYSMVLA